MTSFRQTLGLFFSSILLLVGSGCGGGSTPAPATPGLSLSQATLAFPNTPVGTSAPLSVTLTNTGGVTLSISSVTITGTNVADFAISTNTCGISVAAGANCSVTVTFAPASAASFTASITVTDNAAGSPQSVTLTGTGTAPVAAMSPTIVTFPNTAVGTTASAIPVTLNNTGSAALNIASISIGGTNAADFSIASKTCTSSLAASASCTISVAFTPASAASFSASLLIADNAAGSQQSVALAGTGVVSVASLIPSSLTFPLTPVSVTSAALSTTLTNSGGAPMTISSVTITGTNPTDFAVSANTCGATLGAGNSCTISVTFTPATTGSFSANLTITDNAAGSPQTVPLSGTAAVPVATISPTALAFPTTDSGVTSAPMSATLNNTGNAPLNFTSVTITGTNPSNFAVSANTCGTSLAAGGNCSISVTFTPSSTTASYAAALSVADNASGSPQTVALTGSGGAPGASLSATALNFQKNLVGSTDTLGITLTSSGTGPLLISGITVTGANPTDFAITSNTCPASLPDAKDATAANPSTCVVNVTFTPPSVASFGATLNFADNATGSPQQVTMIGSGAVEPSSCSGTNTTSPAQTPPTPNYPGTAFTGKVQAGTTAVIGASVQIYAAGASGNGSAPTAMLGTALTTDSNGGFSVPASYTCPYSNSVLYAVARGGKVGSTGTVNPAISLASVIGTCNSITGSPTFVLNEVTTAATAWAMAPFFAAGGKIGASATNGTGIVLAAGTFANLVNNLNGTAPGSNFPATGTAPTAKINALANLLNACTASSGAGSTPCTQLFSLTTTATLTPGNTLDAAMNLAANPGLNVAAIYTLSGTSTAFAPALTAAPADWTMFVIYAGGGMNDPSAVSIDSTGKVWVANYFSVASLFTNTGSPVFPTGITGDNLLNSYGGNVDVNDVMWIANEQSNGLNGGLGTMTLLNSSGASPATYSAGGLNFPIAVSFDTSGHSWIANYGNSEVILLTNSGVPLSGTSGYPNYQFEFPVGITADTKCNAYIANGSSDTITFMSSDGTISGSYLTGSGATAVTADGANNIWVANYYGNTVGLLTSTGTILSGNGYTGGGSIYKPQGLAVDGAGNVWVANYHAPANGLGDAITKLAGASATTPGATLSTPGTGWGTDAEMADAYGLAIDGAGNIWISSFATNQLVEFIGLAAPVKTPLLGPVRVP